MAGGKTHLLLRIILVGVAMENVNTEPHIRGTVPLSFAEISGHPHHRQTKIKARDAVSLPLAFDASQKWPHCSSIRTIRHQGACKTCWAVVAASVMADRICISRGVDRPELVSASHAAACANPERSALNNCEQPGNPASVFRRAAVFGIATGAEYGSKSGCVPYDVNPDGPQIPITCTRNCTNEDWPVPLLLDSQVNLSEHELALCSGDRLWRPTVRISTQGRSNSIVPDLDENQSFLSIAVDSQASQTPNHETLRSPLGLKGSAEFPPLLTGSENVKAELLLVSVVDSYWINYGADMSVQSNVDANVLQMKEEIFKYGPIAAQIYDSFPAFTYNPAAPFDGSPPLRPLSGGHAVRITGWNITADGVPYWIIANSWGPAAGDRGYYWIRMGRNVAGVEEWLSAPIVDISSEIKCDTSSFCTSPIDQAIQMDLTGPKSRSFLFQGECIVEVESNNGILTPIEKAVPIAKVLYNAPPPPITATKLIRGHLWLANPSGDEGGNCVFPLDGHKYMCEKSAGRSGLKNSVFQARRGRQFFAYTYNGKTSICHGEATEKQACTYIGSLFTKSEMKVVNGFLNNDDHVNASRKGMEAFVFGKNGAGKSLIGVLAYPTATSNSFMWVRTPRPATETLSC